MFHIQYLGLLSCLLLMALFAASEAALAATNRVRLRHLLRAQASPEDAGAAQLLSSELDAGAQQFIATVTIAANVPLVGASAFTVILALKKFGFEPQVLATCGAIGLLTVALFQVTPRLLVSQPGALERLWWVRPARFIVALLRPPVALLLVVGRLLLRPLGLLSAAPARREDGEDSGLENATEIRDLVESAQASGVLEAGGKELIESIFTFGDTRAHEVMIPRPDMLALSLDSRADAVLDALQESGFSRIPIFEGNVDTIVGVLHAKDVLERLSRDEREFSVRDLMRAPLFLPESQKIDEALTAMRAQRTHLAVVIDEFGGTAGLLTVEDILEELVGDIVDEHDRKEEAPLVILDQKTALVDALFHIEDLEEEWDLALPSGEFDTVGGFMIEQLGRAPLMGDRVETPLALLVVHAMRGRRPKKIMISKKEKKIEVEE